MEMAGGGGLGEVSVDVYADLTRLESDFNKARTATDRFSRDVEQKLGGAAQRSAREMRELDRATVDLARSYSPVHSAMIRYAQDLEKIERLQRAGIFTTQEAAFFNRRAGEELQNSTRETGRMGEYAGRARGQIMALAAAAGVALVGALAAATVAAFRNGKAIKDGAAEIGLSTEAYQEWTYIASQTGVATGQMTQAFENLGRTTARAAAGSRREAGAFALLGISLQDAAGNAKSLEQIAPEVADGLLRIEDANQRAAVAAVFFGEAANEILPALAGGSAGINELADAAHALGIVLSDAEIARLEEAGTKYEQLKTVLSARISSIVAENADSIIRLTDNLMAFGVGALNALDGLIEFTNGPWMQLTRNIAMATTGMGFLIQAQDELANAANRVTELPSEQSANNPLFEVFRNPGGARATGGPPIDASAFLAAQGRTRRARSGGGNGGAAARRAEQERLSALKEQAAYENEIAQLAASLLRAGRARSANADQRAAIDSRLLDIERDRFERTLTLEGPGGTGKYDQLEVERLRVAYMAVDSAERQQIQLDQQDANLEAQTELQSSRIDNERELLGLEVSLARSTRERREAQQALLDLEYDLERIKIQEVLESSKSSDIEKQIANERVRFLDDLRAAQQDMLDRETQGPVADFFDTLQMSADELDDALERIRAADLEGQRQRAVDFADSIGDAFGNAARSIAQLEDPLSIVINLLSDAAAIFTEESLVRPVRDWARNTIGGPLAEQVVGAPAGAEGLWMKTLENSSLSASLRLDQLGMAATRAAQGFSATIIPNQDLAGTSADLGAGLANAASGADAFASSATSAVQQLLSMVGAGGAGGGAGGLFSLGLSLLSGALGGPVGPSAGLVGSASDAIAANPGLFHEGGEVGQDGRPIRRRGLRSGERNITARVGEFMMPEGPTRQFRPLLDEMRMGRLPSLPSFGAGRSASVDRSLHVAFGSMSFPNVTDERTARTTRKQMAAGIQRSIAKASRQGFRTND